MNDSTKQRKLAVIMFTDLVGFSALRRWALPRFIDLRFGKDWS